MKEKISLYFLKNDYSGTLEGFCKSHKNKLEHEYKIDFGNSNPLNVSFDAYCLLSYWAERSNFSPSIPFKKYFRYKDNNFQFCNYLIEFINIFAEDIVDISDKYLQEFVDIFLKTKSKTIRNKLYKASYLLTLAFLSLENRYRVSYRRKKNLLKR